MWLLYVFALARSGMRSSFRRRLLGTVRVCAYVTCVAAVASLLLARKALGRIHDEARVLGAELLPLADLLDGVTELRINGERLNVSVTTVRGTSVQSVLDRFEGNCRENPGPLAKTLRDAAARVPDALPSADEVKSLLNRAALSREETPAFGSVFCMTGRPGSSGSESFAERFAETKDLGTLGNLRYVTARQGDPADGEGDSVKVMALFTEGSFRLASLEPPPNSDAPGSDSRVVPRPPESVRLFSAEAAGAPYAVRLYETQLAPAAALAFYDEAMKGFTAPLDTAEDPLRAYIKAGQSVLVNVEPDGEKTLVTLSELGAAGDLGPTRRAR